MRCNLVSKDREKTETLNTWFPSVSTCKVCCHTSQVPASSGKVCRSKRISTIEEGWFRDHFTGRITANGINMQKSVGLDGPHQRVLRELVMSLWGHALPFLQGPGTWQWSLTTVKDKCHAHLQGGGSRELWLASLISAPGKMTPHILLEAISKCMKEKVTGNSQRGSTKGISIILTVKKLPTQN